MKKRITAAALGLLFCLALAGCSQGQAPAEAEVSQTQTEGGTTEMTKTTEVQNEAAEQTPENMQETTGEPDPEAENNTLIAYFSLIDIVPEGADASAHATPEIGNTESVAMEIQNQVGGDLFAIHTVQNYPVSHSECSGIAKEEMRSDLRPELSTHVEDMSQYDTVYLGYPIWWYQEPMAIRTFLEEYDFAGKTVIPFCTTLGAGISQSEENIAGLIPEAKLLSGLSLSTGRQDNSERVSEWLTEIGMKQ